ncbi:MAG: benzoate-CoA ligase family protein [Gammaproteobacteria bacterium]
MAAPDARALGAAPDQPARPYNAAADLVGRNLDAGRAGKCAYIDDHGRHSYADLERGVTRAAAMLRGLGLAPEQRILIAMHDTVELPMLFLGAIRAGIVPVLVNTLLTADDYAYMLADSRARVAFVSAPLAAQFAGAVDAIPTLDRLVVAGGDDGALAALLDQAGADDHVAATWSDEPCFWLYSSGSTGAPKGTVHVHASLVQTAELYADPVLGIRSEDVVFSAAKLFFAYGLGNALSFPLAVGATTVLMAERPTPDAVFARLREHRATIFYGVPTLYAGLLSSPTLPAADDLALRLCTSAGEALPAEIGRRWHAHFGIDILDGIGSTEMLHIFLSNRPDDVRYGTTGKPVPGYALRLVDERGRDVATGELGELHVAGPTAATQYWNNRARSRATFAGAWTVTGDKYRQDEDGYYVYCGRADDMLKVGGIYVSPAEVENALIGHPAVLEAAVVGRSDDEGLVKPQAFVVLKSGHLAGPDLADALKAHVKGHLAPYKYPRWVEFVDQLPKTATGKIQRFKLRG